MRVLYVLGNYPKISETYVSAEIAYMLRQGVQIEVWTKREGTPGMTAPVRVHRGGFLAALREFRAELVHVHYLVVGDAEILAAGAEGLPVTIRGHSFDFSEANLENRLKCPYVKRVYLFPHFADRVRRDKRVMPMPVAFDSRRYERYYAKDPSLVLRTCAARHTKGIADFLRVSALCPSKKFVLLANTINDGWMPTLRQMVRTMGRVEMFEDLSNEVAAAWTQKAAVYMDTSDPKGHSFGMPISVAESMATGSYVLMRESPEATMYAGRGAAYYETVERAAALVNKTDMWTVGDWQEAAQRAVAAAADYADEAVLPTMLADWRALCLCQSR